MYTNTSSTPRTHARKPSFAGGIMSALAALRTSLRNRNELSVLAEMTDHQLADIGLTRDDVRRALSAPLGNDPAHTLVEARRNNIRRAD